MRKLVGILLLMFQFGTALPAVAAPYCSQVFSDSMTPWGELKEDFPHTTHYTKEIPQETSIKNQCNLGTCHLHSWLASMETRYTQKTGKVITLSNNYESAKQLFARSLDQLHSPGPESKITLGSGPIQSKHSLVSYGVIPEGVWTPKMPFSANPTAAQFKRALEVIIEDTKAARAQETNPLRKQEITREGELKIQTLFQEIVGDLPQQFQWQGRTWSPQEFAKTYFGFFADPVTQMIVRADRKAPETIESLDFDKKVTVNINTLEQKARALIDQNQTVYVAYVHHRNFVDRASGIMSIEAFYTPADAKPLSRKQREDQNLYELGHHVQIVGYETDPKTGHIIKWKIRNSWGSQSGDQGYYHMYNDYFRAFVKSIAYPSASP
jgi:bleomycin hydrolase